MGSKLIPVIKENVDALFHNFNTVMKTCDMEYILFDVPVWKHVYHTLHSMDQWFINPDEFEEPPFHEEGLNSIDIKSSKILNTELLMDYFSRIRKKTAEYIDTLDDAALMEKPQGYWRTRLELIFGQIRHTYSHIGNINATTMIEKKRWPKVVGLTGRIDGELYE